MRGMFVSSIGTSEGKTVVAAALAAALQSSGLRIAAVKPMETGCTPVAQDAQALALAAGDPSLAYHPGFYRAELPASPYAVEIEGERAAPSLAELGHAVALVADGRDGALVEGAGGLFVPINRAELVADLAQALGLPVLLVATNRLGVLSNVLATYEAAQRRSLRIAAIVLNQHVACDDSTRTNRMILAERIACPVLDFPRVNLGDQEQLARAATASGLLRVALRELEA